MSEEILSQQDGPILRITLNRPEAGNGATDGMALELTRLLNLAAGKSRLVVLRGAGKDSKPTARFAGDSGRRDAQAGSIAANASAPMRSNTLQAYETLCDATCSREGACNTCA